MTPKQLRLLEAVARFSGHGWIEIEMELGTYFDGDDKKPEQEYYQRRLGVMSCFRALERRGFVENDRLPRITEKGEKVLKRYGRVS